MRDPKDVIDGMKPWFQKLNKMSAKEKKAWNSAVITISEFVRRLDDYDETRALAIHSLLADKLPCSALAEPAKED